MISAGTMMFALHSLCAVVYVALTVLILTQRRGGATGIWLAGACLATALWAGAVAWQAENPYEGLPGWLLLARGIIWFGFLLHLYRRLTPETRATSPLTVTIALLAVLVVSATPLLDLVSETPTSLFSYSILARIGVAVAILLLLENLYFNTEPAQRGRIGLLCVAVAAMFVYDIVLYSDAVLLRRVSPALFMGRASVVTLAAPLVALAAVRNRDWAINLRVSRGVVFHSATLIASGLFLLALAFGGEILRQTGTEWGLVAEVSLISGGVLFVAAVLTSGRVRARLRAWLVDHFFSFRYDYRQEWIRCIQTLSDADGSAALQTRAIRALAQVVNSPAGALFTRDPDGSAFAWAGSWHMPAVGQPLGPTHPLVCALDQARPFLLAEVPEAETGLTDLGAPWLAVPLLHLNRLTGFVLLAEPDTPTDVDGETRDVLGIIGREVASHVAEQQSARALAETQRLRDYAQRFAFVVHDIKNVSGQLSMLLSNAEVHGDNPEFQRDMLRTIRASVGRIDGMMGRLQRAREGTTEARSIAIGARVAAVVAEARARRGADIRLEPAPEEANVVMDADTFDSLLTHLLDNAIEAAQGRAPVRVALRHDNLSVTIDVIDQGAGMSAEFIRDELFAPLRSTKRDGQGIGVFQARELLRAAGGDLLAISRPGAGTTMRLLLPSVAASRTVTADA